MANTGKAKRIVLVSQDKAFVQETKSALASSDAFDLVAIERGVLDLRGELEALGRTFTTDSDTEVVLQAFAQWGADAFDRLVKAGKVRAIGLSNETPYGVHEFIRLAEQHGLPRVATVQNPYCLVNRTVDNGLDETMHRLGVSLIPYSPLGFGLLTGKYDKSGLIGEGAPANARLTKFEQNRKQRWGRPESLVAARRYNALATANGMTPTQMALAFCYTKWQVASTIIGVTSVAQLDECIDAYGTTLSADVLAEIDKIRWEMRDPAQ
mgnify:CR=1 FL=1